MSDLADMRVVVVGAGIFGSACAVALTRAGARVLWADHQHPQPNTSAIAAGMLAPAFEAALDAQSQGQFGLFAAARDLWPAFIEGLEPTGLEACGALLKAPDEFLAAVAQALRAQGAQLEAGPGVLFTPEDWRIEPELALAAMRRTVLAGGDGGSAGEIVRARADGVDFSSGEQWGADAVVLACGYGGLDLAPELAVLTPIKGQILRFSGAEPRGGPILRAPGGYVVPGRRGPLAGATMQAGAGDRSTDPRTTKALTAQAIRLVPALAGAAAEAFAGVRPTTSDGLPLIGRSASGVWLATGARRNGWLLAPLAAQLIVAGLAGQADDARFSPARFSRPD